MLMRWLLGTGGAVVGFLAVAALVSLTLRLAQDDPAGLGEAMGRATQWMVLAGFGGVMGAIAGGLLGLRWGRPLDEARAAKRFARLGQDDGREG
jgi:hypothetical protein